MRLYSEKGFSLIEILIVVVIIGIIAAIAVPNLLNSLQKSKRSRAMAEIKAIMSSFGSMRSGAKSGVTLTEMENIPIAEILPADAYNGSTKDPWGTDYLFTYRPESSEFIIQSYGKDKTSGASNGDFDSDIIFRNGQFIAPLSAQ